MGTIIIAEDDGINLMYLVQVVSLWLEERGLKHQVESYRDGEGAIEAIRKLGGSELLVTDCTVPGTTGEVVLIMTDFNMGGANGYHVIRAGAQHKVPRFILCTTANTETVELCREAAEGFPLKELNKPCSPSDINQVLDSLFGLKV